jgi:hypothetical protein
MIGGGLAAGVTGLAGGGAAAGAQLADPEIVTALGRLHSVLASYSDLAQPGPLVGVALVRQQQRTYLRANHKYPDFMEIGFDIWESVYFWHIKHRQPVQTGRLNDGRYTLVFMFTTLIMRADIEPTYVGVGFDTPPVR